MYNYDARLYDPAIGMFITPDTLVQNFSDPQTLNRYSYCRNNPLIYTDPSGHWFGVDNIICAVIGAVVGGVNAAMTGQDIWQGMAMGAISGAFMGAFAINGGFVGATIAGAGAGATNAALFGGDIGQAALYGGVIGGALSFGAPQFTPFGKSQLGWVANKAFNSAIVGGAFGGASAVASGGSFKDGFVSGAKGWALGSLGNQFVGHLAGNYMTGGGYTHFDKDSGTYLYLREKADGRLWNRNFNLGGNIIGNQKDLTNRIQLPTATEKEWYTGVLHEYAHNPHNTILGPAYVPAIFASYGMSDAACVLYGMNANDHFFSPFEDGRWNNGYADF